MSFSFSKNIRKDAIKLLVQLWAQSYDMSTNYFGFEV